MPYILQWAAEEVPIFPDFGISGIVPVSESGDSSFSRSVEVHYQRSSEMILAVGPGSRSYDYVIGRDECCGKSLFSSQDEGFFSSACAVCGFGAVDANNEVLYYCISSMMRVVESR